MDYDCDLLERIQDRKMEKRENEKKKDKTDWERENEGGSEGEVKRKGSFR